MKFEDFKTIMQEGYVYIFDANIYLELYEFSTKTSRHIIQLMSQIKDNIIIPSQVELEFKRNHEKAKNVQKKKYDKTITDLKKDIELFDSESKQKLMLYKKYDFPNISKLEEDFNANINQLRDIIKLYFDGIKNDIKENRIFLENDEVNTFFGDLVTSGKLLNTINIVDKINYLQEASFRYANNIPPGYEDREKEGIDKFGDFFIWKEILKLSIEYSDTMFFFVTNDVKEDWWKKRNNKLEGPREELIEEFLYHNIDNGNNINFLDLRTFNLLLSKYYNNVSYIADFELKAEEYVYSFIDRNDKQISEYLIDKIYDNVNDYIDVQFNDYDIEVFDFSLNKYEFAKNDGGVEIILNMEGEAKIHLVYEDDENDRFDMGNVSLTYSFDIELNQEFAFDDAGNLENDPMIAYADVEFISISHDFYEYDEDEDEYYDDEDEEEEEYDEDEYNDEDEYDEDEYDEDEYDEHEYDEHEDEYDEHEDEYDDEY